MKSFQKMKKGNDVPRVVILIEMAVLVILLTSVHHYGLLEEEKEITPTVGITLAICGYALNVEKCEPDPVSIFHVNYLLINVTRKMAPGGNGTLCSIYGLNLDFHSANITFFDNDGDLNISHGDVFLLRRSADGGNVLHGYRFLLIYTKTGGKMNGGGAQLSH